MKRMYDENEIKTIANTIIDDTQAAIDSTYSSSKITKELNKKQNKLISGSNIKTINGTSILGSGNVEAGGKLYMHKIKIHGSPTEYTSFTVYSSKQAQYNLESFVADFCFDDRLCVGGRCEFTDNNNRSVYSLIDVSYKLATEGNHIDCTYAESSGNVGTRVYQTNSSSFMFIDMVKEL